MNLLAYVNAYKGLKNQEVAVDWLFDTFQSSDNVRWNEFVREWKGSSDPKGSNIFQFLSTKGYQQTHQLTAIGYVAAWFESQSKVKDEFASKWSANPSVKEYLTKAQLEKLIGGTINEQEVARFNQAVERLDSKTHLVIAHFLAQVLHESGNLRYRKEIATGDAYEGRKDLGNTQRGDGRRFKGAGAIQLTGRFNYEKFSKWVRDPEVMRGVDYVADRYFWETAVWYWNSRGLSRAANSDSLPKVTRLVNGGLNGFSDRLVKLTKAKQILGLPITPQNP